VTFSKVPGERIVSLREPVRAALTEMDEIRRLPPSIVDPLTAAGVFRMGVPSELGGPETPLLRQLETFEELGRADGSVGWCAMIGALTSASAGYLPEVEAKAIFADPDARVGGIVAPTGRAVIDGDRLRLTGRWAFGSGVTHSDWFAVGALVGDPPAVRMLFMPTNELEIEDTWDTSGLRGTGSNHVRAENIRVPSSRSFALPFPEPIAHGPLYRFPLFSSLAVGVASVALGIARDALDELDVLATGKTPTGQVRTLGQRSHIQRERAEAEAELRSARALLFSSVERIWQLAEEGSDPAVVDRAALRLAATHAVRTSARVVDRAYDAGGGTSIFSDSRLQRDFRDVHAITQHMVVGVPTLEVIGRVLLGVETDVTQL
jgi:alkylation response protein AidB-like acyl-CoA dehydrogenase